MEEETQGRIIPPFLTKVQLPHRMDTTATSVQKSLHALRRSRRRCRDHPPAFTMNKKKKLVEVKGTVEKEEKESEDDDDDDREEVERKILALQRIVPNGHSFGVDQLFDETAGYIMSLHSQLKTLKALTAFLEKDKSKLGG